MRDSMYDHYYEITRENSIFDEYFQYLKDEEEMRTAIKEFKEKHGIKAESYIYAAGKLWVKPDENKEFATQFCKESDRGYKPFKKTSPIGRAFTAASIKKAVKPFVPWCFKDHIGKMCIRLFDYEGKLYCQYSTEFEITDTPAGFTPIKASDFYKVIEIMESKRGDTNG